MLYGHDEGKNIKRLCDGVNEVVCVEMGGTGANNAEDAISNLGISGAFEAAYIKSASITVAASGEATATIDLNKPGYTLLGVTGVVKANAPGASGASNCVMGGFSTIENNFAKVTFRNLSTTERTIICGVDALYFKN